VVANGITITAGGTINTGTVSGSAGYGLWAFDGGSISTNAPITVITGGPNARGASAEFGGLISLSHGGAITTSGGSAFGLVTIGPGSHASATGMTIETTGGRSAPGGFPSHGVFAADGGSIGLAGGSVTTRGESAFGLYATDLTRLEANDTLVRTYGDAASGANVSGGRMLLNNVTIETAGLASQGIRTENLGIVEMSGGKIATAGDGGSGVFATGNSKVFLSDVAILVNGADAWGIGAQRGAQIAVTGGSIITTGERGYGVSSAQSSAGTTERASVGLTGTTITTAGSGAHGVLISGPADATLSNSTVTATGLGASALYSAAPGAGSSTATITGSTLVSSLDFGVRTDGTTFDVSLTDSTVGGGAGLLISGNGAVLNLTADSSTLVGGALTDAASISNLTLQNGTRWTLTGNGSSVTSLTLDNATVRLDNDSDLSAGNGIVLLAGGGTFDTRGLVGTVSSALSGPGRLEKAGAGTLVLTAANVYAGSTTITQGKLQLGNGGTTGSITGDVLNNGVLAFARNDTVVFSGVVTGAGQLEQAGSGTTILTGANGYSGGTLISQGTLQLGDGGTTGSIAGDVTNLGTLAFNRSDNFLVNGAITGSGRVVQSGTGRTVLAGDNAYTGGTTIAAGTLQLGNGGTTGAVQGDVVNNGALVLNRSNELRMNGAISGTGSVTQAGSGVTILAGANSYGASTTVSAGTLAAGATKAFSASSDHVVQAGGTLDLRGFDQTVASLNNGGMVRLGGLPGTTLSVSNAYVSQGGFLSFNTVLDGDASSTDRMIAARVGLGSDATRLIVNKVGGAGALTAGNGIQLIHVNDAAASAPEAFKLTERLTSGAYEYSLYRGGIGGAASDGNWYLRSTLDCTLSENASACGLAPPVDPPVGPAALPILPNYRAETSLYTALPSMTLLYGQSLMDSRVERIGDENAHRAALGSQGWGRVIGLRGSRDGSSDGIYNGSPAYDYDIFALQTGVDLYREDHPDGSGDRAGFYAAVGQISADVTHFNGRDAGKNKIDAYSLGAYWTRLGATGWYLDGVGQLTWNDARSTPNGISGLSTNGLGVAASLEGGQRFLLHDGFSVEPQAQLIYQAAHLSDSSDAAASVRFSNIDSLAARVGVRFAKAWPLDGQADSPRQIKAWLRPSVWHEFLGQPKTEFSSATGSIPFKDDLSGSWAEITAGLDANIHKNASVYGNVGYQVAFDGKSDAYSAKVGLRITW
jgi:outer membrane autotransporter protein